MSKNVGNIMAEWAGSNPVGELGNLGPDTRDRRKEMIERMEAKKQQVAESVKRRLCESAAPRQMMRRPVFSDEQREEVIHRERSRQRKMNPLDLTWMDHMHETHPGSHFRSLEEAYEAHRHQKGGEDIIDVPEEDIEEIRRGR